MDNFSLPAGTRIGSVSLQVSSISRSLEFYGSLLGLHSFGKVNGEAALSATGRSPSLIELRELGGAIPRPRGTTGLYHTAILFPNRRELGRALNRLLAHRYPLQGASDHGVSEAIYLTDPDGLGVELYVDKPKHEWPRRGGQLEMVSEPFDVDTLLAESEVTGDDAGDPATMIGHLHLHVSDLANAEEFYNRVMGFTVTQRSYPGARFLAAGDYHHHIGVNTWAGKNAPPANASGLVSFKVLIPASSFDQFWRHLETTGAPYSLENGNETGEIILHDRDGNAVRVAPDLSAAM